MKPTLTTTLPTGDTMELVLVHGEIVATIRRRRREICATVCPPSHARLDDRQPGLWVGTTRILLPDARTAERVQQWITAHRAALASATRAHVTTELIA